MATNYLISTESLKKKGLIHQNSDTKILSVAINRVQAMNIQPALGSPLFRQLLDNVSTNTWTTDYRELMDEYVVPSLVALVDYKVALLSNVKITNKSVGRTSDENTTANSTSETISFRDELHKDAEFYLERLIGFLKDDCGVKYPEYTEAITRTNHDLKKIDTGYRINWSK